MAMAVDGPSYRVAEESLEKRYVCRQKSSRETKPQNSS
jgi:hypothetical protein